MLDGFEMCTFFVALRNVEWWFLTDVSGETLLLIYKRESVQALLKMNLIGFPKTSVKLPLYAA